jgi:Tol biopolymer transport system component
LFFAKGITEMHAVFEYSGMSPDYTWERVWYLNDKEIARVSESWSGPEAGVFDYFVDNRGRALPAGDWVLELYVEGKLQALGVFIIEEAEATAGSGVYSLVYTKCEGDHHNIYVADTNGQNERLIVTRGAGPSWSPGGGSIFFYGEAGVDRQARDGLEYVFDGVSNGIVVMKAAPLPVSIDQLNLFQSSEWKQGTARWANVSPDGSMVAFDANLSGDYRIYFLGTASNQQFRYEIIGEQADWSPDSQWVVYRSGRDGKTGLWISNRTDSGYRLLTNGGSDSFPVWSPDGQMIAFSRDEGGNVDIYTVNADGSNLKRLTNTPGHDTLPTFAPNGDILFRSARTGSWGIWKMKADGSDQVEIIANACVGNEWAYSRMDVLQ